MAQSQESRSKSKIPVIGRKNLLVLAAKCIALNPDLDTFDACCRKAFNQCEDLDNYMSEYLSENYLKCIKNTRESICLLQKDALRNQILTYLDKMLKLQIQSLES